MKRGPKRLRHSHGNLVDTEGWGGLWVGGWGAYFSGDGERREVGKGGKRRDGEIRGCRGCCLG